VYLKLKHHRELMRQLPDEKKCILENCPDAPQNIIDIGCGPGFFTSCLSEIYPHAQVVGFDGDRQYIEEARGSFKRSNLEFHFGDIREIEREKSDLLIFCGVIEHLPNVGSVLKNINRLAADGGILFIATDNAFSLKFLLANLYHSFFKKKPSLYLWHHLDRHYWWNQHIYTWTLASLSTLLELYGFTLENFWFTNHFKNKLILDKVLDSIAKFIPGFRRNIVLKLVKTGEPTIIDQVQESTPVPTR